MRFMYSKQIFENVFNSKIRRKFVYFKQNNKKKAFLKA